MISTIVLLIASIEPSPAPPGWYPVPPGLERDTSPVQPRTPAAAPESIPIPDDSATAWLANATKPAAVVVQPVQYEQTTYQRRGGRSLFRSCGG